MTYRTQVAHQIAQDVLRFLDTNPLWTRHAPITVVNETNITTNTTSYGYFNLTGYKHWGLQGITSGTTPTDILTSTVELSWQPGDDPTALSYEDVTRKLWGVDSWVDEDFNPICNVVLGAVWGRLKYVTSNDSGNDADLTAYLARIY